MAALPTETVQGTILIADDDPISRQMLRLFLQQDGYVIHEVDDGPEAIRLYESLQPDLILLDAMMPNMTGFEACTRLQALPGGDQIPILIITGLDDEESVDQAFTAGAIDYITKPVHWPVLRQRVRRLIRNRQTEKMRDDLIQMIVHDMKNPISTIRGFSELLLDDMSDDVFLTDTLRRIYYTSNSLLEMTMMILDMGRLDAGKITLEPVEQPVHQMLAEVQDGFNWMASNYGVKLEVGHCDEQIVFTLDWTLIKRVLANLVSNAIKHSAPQSTVTLFCNYVENTPECAGYLELSVSDTGEGIAERDQKRIFEKFAQASQRTRGSRMDTGLGLTFCKLATEANGGKIELKSALGMGSTFTLVFPASV